jgi:hypothetical protein
MAEQSQLLTRENVSSTSNLTFHMLQERSCSRVIIRLPPGVAFSRLLLGHPFPL